MPLPLPLLPTSFLDSQGNVNKAWYDFLMSLATSRAWIVPSYLIFDDDTARDTYFASHSGELVEGLKVCSDSVLQMYSNNSWVDMTTFIQGEKGDAGQNGATGAQGPKGDPSNSVSVELEPTWSVNGTTHVAVATLSSDDYSGYDEFVVGYDAAVVTFNKNYSALTQIAQGETCEYKVVLNKSARTITFTPNSTVSGTVTVDSFCYGKVANSSGLVPATRKVAGYSLSADITVANLSTALGIGSLATSSELAAAIAGLSSVYQPIGSYVLSSTAEATYQAKALAASIDGALSPTTQYPSVKAVSDYALAKNGGTATGDIVNDGGTTLLGKAHRNIQFVEGTTVEALASLTDVEDGDIVFLYTPLA